MVAIDITEPCQDFAILIYVISGDDVLGTGDFQRVTSSQAKKAYDVMYRVWKAATPFY